jgi:hypothetical protein
MQIVSRLNPEYSFRNVFCTPGSSAIASFSREDNIGDTWRILEPVLDRPAAPHSL